MILTDLGYSRPYHLKIFLKAIFHKFHLVFLEYFVPFDAMKFEIL